MCSSITFSPKFLMQSILSESKQCIMCIAKFVMHGCCLLISIVIDSQTWPTCSILMEYWLVLCCSSFSLALSLAQFPCHSNPGDTYQLCITYQTKFGSVQLKPYCRVLIHILLQIQRDLSEDHKGFMIDPYVVVACFLVQEGGDLHIKNNNGISPLQLCPSDVSTLISTFVQKYG